MHGRILNSGCEIGREWPRVLVKGPLVTNAWRWRVGVPFYFYFYANKFLRLPEILKNKFSQKKKKA